MGVVYNFRRGVNYIHYSFPSKKRFREVRGRGGEDGWPSSLWIGAASMRVDQADGTLFLLLGAILPWGAYG
jgi:hypothetical protein